MIATDPSSSHPGHRVVIAALGHEPIDAIERFASLEPMAAPDRPRRFTLT